MHLHPPVIAAILRKQKEDNLPHSAQVSTVSTVRGSGGMNRYGVPVLVGEYNCHASLVSSVDETLRADAMRLGAQWVVVFPLSANVQHGNRLDVNGGNWGRSLEVVGVAAPGARLARVVFAREAPSTAAVVAAPPVGAWLEHEPAGMTLLRDRAFTTHAEANWDTGVGLTIENDVLALQSPPAVIRATYPPGHPAGNEPVNGASGTQHALHKNVFIAFAFRLSPNWVGNGSGTNKLFYERVLNPDKPVFFLSAEGGGDDPLRPYARLQDIVTYPGGSGNLAPNLVPLAEIVRGQRHKLSVYLQGNSPGNADGAVDWWLDGVKVGAVGGIQWTPLQSEFNIFELRPIWGGANVDPPIVEEQWLEVDHVTVSGKTP